MEDNCWCEMTEDSARNSSSYRRSTFSAFSSKEGKGTDCLDVAKGSIRQGSLGGLAGHCAVRSSERWQRCWSDLRSVILEVMIDGF